MKALALEMIVGREESRRTRKYAIVEDVDIKDNGKVIALRLEVYIKWKEVLIKRYFVLEVTQQKGGNIVWICEEDNIIREKKYCKSIKLHTFYYNHLKKRRLGGCIWESICKAYN